jgi:hypothetical protein
MQVYITMFPIESGAYVPFNHVFQRYMYEQVTKLIAPSSWFAAKYGEDWKLIFRISARWSPDEDDTDRGVKLSETARASLARYRSFTSDPLRVEVRGPTIFKKAKDVEYSIFLPFRHIVERGNPTVAALQHIFAGVYAVLEKMEFDTSTLRAEQDRIIKHVCSEPKMIDLKLASRTGIDPAVWGAAVEG